MLQFNPNEVIKINKHNNITENIVKNYYSQKNSSNINKIFKNNFNLKS